MVVVTTTTTATTTTLLNSPMSLSSNSETNHTPTNPGKSIDVDPPAVTMEPFTPGQCLFCPNPSPGFTESVAHMQKSHGLFIPHQQNLVVDLETLFKYLHLVIFGYRECIHCGTERATVQAVQQHMTGKGHCRFDVEEEDSEFAEFYDFYPTAGDDEEQEEDHKDEDEGDEASSNEEQDDAKATVTAGSSRRPRLADEDSIRLPSGRIISRQPSTQTGSYSAHQPRRQARTPASSRLEYGPAETEAKADREASTGGGGGEPGPGPSIDDRRLLSKREKRERANVTYQLASLSVSDRNSLTHLSASEQRSLLATQHRHAERVQKAERRRQGKIDRKGNKNLYAYWHTETPVYQCG